jgi:hypothetical protein
MQRRSVPWLPSPAEKMSDIASDTIRAHGLLPIRLGEIAVGLDSRLLGRLQGCAVLDLDALDFVHCAAAEGCAMELRGGQRRTGNLPPGPIGRGMRP